MRARNSDKEMSEGFLLKIFFNSRAFTVLSEKKSLCLLSNQQEQFGHGF